ncbi:FtsJ-domain-containing protein [Rhizodiscina lignyota]|uniref:rRNA methyltransferase 2, mitochondrial n=1 Tax=Rhizodiscina lignyota TaxID=1504668 RepID=A0A9P4IMI9_9PEZI|nr:FtsJ-domain-containing protein [Rhizodiscina lignyota]
MLSRSLFQQLTDSILISSYIIPNHTRVLSRNCLRLSQNIPFAKHASSSSSTRWKARQSRDRFAKDAKVQGLKSRAAFKLLEMNEKYKLFRPGITVVDLGYAPGSWSQVAVSRTQPRGRVIGIDIIPAQPPRGVSTIQGNFLDPGVQESVRTYVQDPDRGRPRRPTILADPDFEANDMDSISIEELEDANKSYIDLERQTSVGSDIHTARHLQVEADNGVRKKLSTKERDERLGRVVDVVLSDMSAPWELTSGMWVNSVSNPYRRMMNTSGVSFRDHAGSMDLCIAALTFCFDALRTGGHFVCKFYQGAEEKLLEKKLKRLFEKVHREKPDASRDGSKEAYFVALKRKADPPREQVFADD